MRYIGLAKVESYADTTLYRMPKIKLIRQIRNLEHEYGKLSFAYLDLKDSMNKEVGESSGTGTQKES